MSANDHGVAIRVVEPDAPAAARSPGAGPAASAASIAAAFVGARCGPVILEYGDYQCPYSRRAFRSRSSASSAARTQATLRVQGLPQD